MKNRKKILYFVAVVFLMQMIFLPSLALAQDDQRVIFGEKPQIKFNIPLPGTSYNEPGKLYALDLADYIGMLYKYSLSIVTLLAVFMIMVAGVIWLTAGGSPDKVKNAKDMIASSLIGLLLMLFSYLILNTINPALIKLEVSKIQTIAGVKTICCKLPPGQSNVSDTSTAAGAAMGAKSSDYVERLASSCLPDEKEITCPTGGGIKGVADKWCDPEKPESCSPGEKCIAGAGATEDIGLCSTGVKGSSCKIGGDPICKDSLKCEKIKGEGRPGIGSCEDLTKGLSTNSRCSDHKDCESKICEKNACSSGKKGEFCFMSGKCAEGFQCVGDAQLKMCERIK